MNEDMKLYYDYTISPLGELFYQTVWSQMSDIKDKKVLDFGSGFGFTSHYLAQNNELIAVEKDEIMIAQAQEKEAYPIINGDLDCVKKMESESYDVVVCHLVLEFVENPEEIIGELVRVLKRDGILSIVKHNKNGRIIQALAKDYDLKDVHHLLNGGYSYSSAFGDIKYYDNESVVSWSDNQLTIQETFGVRAVASIQDGEIQQKEGWLTNMLEIEKVLCRKDEFIPIAFFNHIRLKKVCRF